jgi:3-dehydroquinate synthase
VRDQVVKLTFDYPVCFTRDVLDPAEPALIEAMSRKEPGRRHRAMIVVDDGVAKGHPGLVERFEAFARAHGERVELAGRPVVVPGGEVCKNDPAHLAAMLDRMHDLALDRHAFVVAVGGGAVLDMVGYAAAITHRGVRVVRLPTTTLAQGDSGVGVKNGVNAYGKKNYLGTFAPPFAVINDRRLLSSLGERDRVAGLAEGVKVGLVKDARFFSWIDERASELRAGGEDLHVMIRKSCELHLDHIATSGDPFELGSARPLDYGHWSAHKLESLTKSRLRHGEAVSIGMALDAIYAQKSGIADVDLPARLCDVLARLGLPLWDEALEDPALFRGLDEFREHLGGDLTITLLRRPGEMVEVHEIDAARMQSALEELRRRVAR